ncbi:MAG TPA: DNA polymerase III subunit delta' [Dehalococcoidia bacterium]|nr:DNA polymerase III subunit delta' [Dehalococcoidia bacterium]
MRDWGLIGQGRAVRTLDAALRQGRLHHAHLLVGPPHVGKGTLALRLAQALNCQAPLQERPCLSCRQCRRLEGRLHADLHLLTVEPPHREIRIVQVRELERALALKPFEGRTRVAIVDPADAMNLEAQNAFLKTLEEPPPDTVLVLVTARETVLLPTIRSRCQRTALGTAPAADLAHALMEEGLGRDDAELLARWSEGRPGLALSLARDPEMRRQREAEVDRALSLAEMPLPRRLALADELAQLLTANGRDREEGAPPAPAAPFGERLWRVLDVWQSVWRDVLLVAVGAEGGIVHRERLDGLRALAARVSAGQVMAFLRALWEARRYLEENVSPRLVLEDMLLEAPQAHVNVV